MKRIQFSEVYQIDGLSGINAFDSVGNNIELDASYGLVGDNVLVQLKTALCLFPYLYPNCSHNKFMCTITAIA